MKFLSKLVSFTLLRMWYYILEGIIGIADVCILILLTAIFILVFPTLAMFTLSTSLDISMSKALYIMIDTAIEAFLRESDPCLPYAWLNIRTIAISMGIISLLYLHEIMWFAEDVLKLITDMIYAKHTSLKLLFGIKQAEVWVFHKQVALRENAVTTDNKYLKMLFNKPMAICFVIIAAITTQYLQIC